MMTRACLCLFTAVVLLTSTAERALADADGDDDTTVVPNIVQEPNFTPSTVPTTGLETGDLNPYGVAFAPTGFPTDGTLHPRDILVANFNNSGNLQGTGTSIVKIDPTGAQTVFFENGAFPGLDTALGVFEAGFVVVGHVPSTDGSGVCTPGKNGEELNVGAGSLVIIDRNGVKVQEIADSSLLDGPWDLTIKDGDQPAIFVSNVLSGTVTRLDVTIQNASSSPVSVVKMTQIASGYKHRCDPAAFVVGPTGVALDVSNDILYVASTADNAIYAIPDASSRQRDAGKGKLTVRDPAHLHGPLGLVLAQNGNLVSAQGDAVNPDVNQPSEIVEFTPAGRFVAQRSIDPALGGAFGVALEPGVNGFRFAAVDDNFVPPATPVLDIWVIE